jgi:hypothetical protein
MPFLTACPFCPARMKVPDQWLGASLCCPKCGSNFTAAPVEPAPARGSVRPPAGSAPPRAAPQRVAAAQALPAPPASPAPPAPGPAAAAVVPEPLPPTAPLPEPDAGPGWINTWGVIAFFLAGLGVLLAGLSFPRWLTLTLAGLGLPVALAGVVAAQGSWRTRDRVWLSLGGGGSAALLVLALSLPSWLNTRWGMDFAVPEPDRDQQLAVSRDNKAVVKELAGEDWVDAETNAVRQGDVLVRVEGAAVDWLPGSDRPVLLVTLHVANVGPLRPVPYDGQGGGQHPAVLRDGRGTELARRDLGSQARKAGQVHTVSVLPTHEVQDVVASEPPWPGSDRVDLELPAAAWGGQGVCKFRIPKTFIIHKRRPE